MWTRKELKTKAKKILKKSYWKCFWVSLVILIAGGNLGGTGGSRSNSSDRISDTFDQNPEMIMIVTVIILTLILLFIAFRIFVGYILEVGGRKFFIKACEEEVNTSFLKYYFKKGMYKNIISTMLLRSIYTLLWTLLLIIPGIIKLYAYRFVPYILADNPYMEKKRAIELSTQMTNGEKIDMFVLDLSFIGWYILGTIALGIGVLFVNPYVDATNAQLYLALKKRLLEDGLASSAEFIIIY